MIFVGWLIALSLLFFVVLVILVLGDWRSKAPVIVLLDLTMLSPAVQEPPIGLFLLHCQMTVCSVVPSCLLPIALSLLFCDVLFLFCVVLFLFCVVLVILVVCDW